MTPTIEHLQAEVYMCDAAKEEDSDDSDEVEDDILGRVFL